MGIFKKRNCLVSYPLMICFLQPFPCHILHLFTYFYFVMSIPSRFSVVVIMFKCLYKQTKTNIWYRNIWNKLIEHNEYIYIYKHASSKINNDWLKSQHDIEYCGIIGFRDGSVFVELVGTSHQRIKSYTN